MKRDMKQWLWEKKAETCIKNLKKHQFDAHYVESSEDAKKLIIDLAGHYDTFGFGGSATTSALGIKEALKALGKTLYDHNQEGLTFESTVEFRKKQGVCDCFLCSANGISTTGEIVNVDGVGNRTNAMTFGPKKVIVVAGINKITPNLESAIKRVHDIAAPMRAKDLGIETPCVETGTCVDCNAPMRICRVTAILHRKPMMTDVSVILVNEELGY